MVSKECQLVTLMDVVSGKLEVSTTHVYFYDKSSAGEEGMALFKKLKIKYLFGLQNIEICL